MRQISIITGGAGGMGFATAALLGRDTHVVISDISAQRLDAAIARLAQLNISCSAVVCDITDRSSVDRLFQQAGDLGQIKKVVHTAGVSPLMAEPVVIMKVNALGTLHVTEAAYQVASEGFSQVNIASMAAYMMPSLLIPRKTYVHADTQPDKFLRKSTFFCRLLRNDRSRNGLAYGISKNFVIWYTKKNAARFGEKGARLVSVSPGTFDTEMGRLEEKNGALALLNQAALKRPGRPEEIAALIAFCVSDKASYLTGVDILCDGGVIASRT